MSLSQFVSGANAAGRGVKRYAARNPNLYGMWDGGMDNVTGNFPMFNPGQSYDPGFHQDGMNPFGPAFHSIEDVNPRVIIQGRRYKAIGAHNLKDADLGPPTEHRLAFVYRAPGRQPNIEVFTESPDLFSHSLAGSDSSEHASPFGLVIQGEPALGTDPTCQNFLLATLAEKWGPQPGWKHVTAQMIYSGTKNLGPYYDPRSKKVQELNALDAFKEFEGFSPDGVPRNTIAEDGTAPQHNDGLVSPNGYTLAGRAEKSIIAAVTRKGRETMCNYWGDEGVRPGARMYAILKKYEYDQYDRSESTPGNVLSFNLTAKSHDEFRDGASMVRTINVGQTRTRGGQDVPTLPYAWGFVCCYGPLDREHLRFKHEDGRVDYGVGVLVAIVHSAPIRSRYLPSLRPGEVRPHMDNRDATRNDTVDVVMNLDDGFSCLN
jgi:hypothetical protein